MEGLKRNGPDGGTGDEGTSIAAVTSAMAALPGEALEDFRAQLKRGGPPAAIRERTVFDCITVNGHPLPIKPRDRTHPLWREIAAGLADRKEAGAGLALRAHLALFLAESAERPGHILILPDEAIVLALAPLIQGGKLTAAELRLLKQIVCGMDLADAARSDGVSRETRRSQFKALSRKLGCRSQVEVVSRVLAHLLFEPARPAHRSAGTEITLYRDLVREFIPQARTFELTGPSGILHRFIDLGPPDGRPVAFVHPQILPDFRPQDIAVLVSHGLRLVVPLRNGAMSGAAVHLDVADHMDHACEGIELVRTHFAGESVDLLGCISGAAYAIEYARRYPERVGSLALVGAPASPNVTGAIAGRMRAGMYRLAEDNWRILSLVLDFYGRRINRPETLQQFLMGYYRSCPADMAVMEAEYAAPHRGERGRGFLTASIDSIKHDFLHQAFPRWQYIPKECFPIAFFHGTQDFTHPLGAVREIASRIPGASVHPVAGGGQLLYYQYFEPLLSCYSAFLTASR